MKQSYIQNVHTSMDLRTMRLLDKEHFGLCDFWTIKISDYVTMKLLDYVTM